MSVDLGAQIDRVGVDGLWAQLAGGHEWLGDLLGSHNCVSVGAEAGVDIGAGVAAGEGATSQSERAFLSLSGRVPTRV